MIALKERTARIEPIKSRLKISLLEEEEIAKINQTARDIMEAVGVLFPSQMALEIFADAGAHVDFDHKIWPSSILHEMSNDAGSRYRDPVEVAQEMVEWILKNHKPAPLSEDVSQELRRIVEAADRDEELERAVKGG